MCMHTYVFVNLATPGDNHACAHHPLQVGVWPCEEENPLLSSWSPCLVRLKQAPVLRSRCCDTLVSWSMSKRDLVPRQQAWSSPSFLGDGEVRVWRWFVFHQDPSSSSLSSSFVSFCLKKSRRRCLSLPLPAQLPISSPLGLEADRERRLCHFQMRCLPACYFFL